MDQQPDQSPLQPGTASFDAVVRGITEAINSVVDGKEEAVRTALRVLLAGGHPVSYTHLTLPTILLV